MWSRRAPTRSTVAESLRSVGSTSTAKLIGRRVVLRPLDVGDFEQWRDVRRRSEQWLTPWEPQRVPGGADPIEDRSTFNARCGARHREIQMGSGYGFGIFVEGHLAGEININSIHRGPFQSAYVGYWIDVARAGHGYTPEAVVLVMQFAFEQLQLHRLQIAIIPRNAASRRVAEKLGLRNEGTALRYLEINGVWEDHVRYGITAEDWDERGADWLSDWVY